MQKALRGCARLSLVDKVIEISNLELVKDIIELHAAFASWKDYSP